MKILLCGSHGQLGWDCRRVFENENELKTFDRPNQDITDRDKVLDICLSFMPDVVINCAAYTQVDKCESERDAAWVANVKGPENLAHGCRESGAMLVHVSTDYVFDGKKEPPLFYSEADEVHPLSVYGDTKLEGEKIVSSIIDNHIIVRTSWLYGISGHNFLKTMLRLALEAPEKSIKVVNDQFGSPTWSLRLALQIERLIQIKGQGIYHATSEGYCSWYEFASYFLKLMDVPFNIVPCATEEYPTPARRPFNSILENARLKRSDNNRMTGWRYGVEKFVSRYHDQLIDEIMEMRQSNAPTEV